MELLQLTYFCEAARKENFSRTAKKFSVPASDISQSVSRLERELGRKLFDRHPNRIVLNDYGKAFLEQIQPALAGIDAAVRKMSDSDMDMKTELRLQICVCRSIVTEAIERFRPAYPDVTFYISHSSAPDDDADIIIADSKFPAGTRCRHVLFEENILLAVEKSNPLSCAAEMTADMLKKERFITMPEGSSMFSITCDVCAQYGFEPEIAIQSDDPFYIRKYVEMGLGIAFFPESSWKGQFGDNVVIRKTGEFRRKTCAYCSVGHGMTRAGREFLAMLKEAFDSRKGR